MSYSGWSLHECVDMYNLSSHTLRICTGSVARESNNKKPLARPAKEINTQCIGSIGIVTKVRCSNLTRE